MGWITVKQTLLRIVIYKFRIRHSPLVDIKWKLSCFFKKERDVCYCLIYDTISDNPMDKTGKTKRKQKLFCCVLFILITQYIIFLRSNVSFLMSNHTNIVIYTIIWCIKCKLPKKVFISNFAHVEQKCFSVAIVFE